MRAIIKDFAKSRQEQLLFTEEFRILLSAYDPGLSGFYQPVHMLVGIQILSSKS